MTCTGGGSGGGAQTAASKQHPITKTSCTLLALTWLKEKSRESMQHGVY